MEPGLTSVLPAVWMITAAFCFATMGALTHAIGPRCDWLGIAFFRISCTFLLSVGIAWGSRTRLVFVRPRTLWIRSTAGTISLLCTFYALTRLPVADVLMLSNTYPLWIVLLSMRQSRGNRLWTDIVCVVSGVVGVAMIQRPYLSGRGDFAVVVALMGSFATAVAMLGLHRLRGVDAPAVVAHFSGLSSLSLAAGIGLRRLEGPIAALDSSSAVMLVGVGLTGTMGQMLITKAFAAGPPARISVLSLTQVVFAMIYDLAIEGRVLTLVSILGFILVLAPTAWITLRAGALARDGKA